MKRQRKYIPFGPFEPSSSDFGEGKLDLAQNLYPSYDGYRSLRKPSAVSFNVRDTASGVEQFQGINGAIGHNYLISSTNQKERPDGVSGTPDFFRSNEDYDQEDLHELVNSKSSDTSTFVVSGGGEDGQIEFEFPEFETPSSSSGWILRTTYKIEGNESGTWDVEASIYEGATLRWGPSSIASDTTESTSWATEETAIGSMAAVTAHDDLRVVYDITINDSGDIEYPPTSQVSNTGGWKDESGSTSSIHTSIDESSTDTADFIKSPNVSNVSAEPTVKFDFAGVEDHGSYYPPSYSPAPFVLRLNSRTPHDNLELCYRLMNPDGSIAREDDIPMTSSASFANESNSISLSNVTGYGTFSLEVFSKIAAEWKSADGTTGTAEADIFLDTYPTSDDISGSGATAYVSGDYTDVDDTGDDGDFITVSPPALIPSGTAFPKFNLELGNYEYPGIPYGSSVTVRGRNSSADSAGIWIRVTDGTNVLVEQFETMSSGFSEDFVLDLDSNSVMSAIASSSDIFVQIEATSFEPFQISSVYLNTPEVSQIQISRIWLDVSPPSKASLAWVELDMPSSNTNYNDDEVQVYAGDNNRLWRVGSSGFTNVTREVQTATEVLYGDSTDPPRPWDFQSYGNDVIATNYVDEVQWLPEDATDDEFEDLITSTAKPKARFVTVVRDQVVLAHCVGTGASESYSDTVWWSAIGDPQDFDLSQTTLSGSQRIVDTPGQITGLVGGDYGLIFKRNSITRMEWAGYPYIYEFKVPSKNIGTPYPKSIVSVENDVFFYSDGGFAVLEGGSKVTYLNDPLGRFLSDPDFSEQAFSFRAQTTGVYDDLAMFGSYDPHSRLIFWFYAGPNSFLWADAEDGVSQAFNDAVVLDTRTGEWGYLNLLENSVLADYWKQANVTASITVNKPDVTSGVNNSGTGFFGWQDAMQYDAANTDGDGAQVYFNFGDQEVFDSKISTKKFPMSEHEYSTIYEILPVYGSRPSGVSDPDVTITVRSAQDPLFRDTREVVFTERNSNGWYQGIVSGEWFEIDFEFEGGNQQFIKDVIGFYVSFTDNGDRGGK